MARKVFAAISLGLFCVAATAVAVYSGALAPLDYQNATVTLRDANGTTLTTVDVRVSDSQRERYVGLSHTDSLADGEGMLFVHDREGTHTYVMRDMAFPLDMVFADANGTITTIHHAPVEPNVSDRNLTKYPGRGTYVLEVPYGYTNRTGVDVGDRLVVPERFR